MRVAASDVAWTAQPSSEPPHLWGHFKSEDLLLLKDTRSAHWKNELRTPNTFVYVFPRNSRHEWERTLVNRLVRRYETGVPLVVHLFSTPGSRNEFYGEWVVDKMTAHRNSNTAELVLKRLEVQTPDLYARTRRTRSNNEKRHGRLLSERFPDWTVDHEPETLLDLHDPTVVDGVAQNVVDISRSYTCDFVLAKGLMRVCVESKYDESEVTPAALVKARILRDRTLTRVVFLVGHGGEDRWLDLGKVRSDDVPRWLALDEFPSASW